jgi:hypothetical protein
MKSASTVQASPAVSASAGCMLEISSRPASSFYFADNSHRLDEQGARQSSPGLFLFAPLGEFRIDQLDQDAAAPVGKGEMTILKDMESFDQEHEQYMQELKSGSHLD